MELEQYGNKPAPSPGAARFPGRTPGPPAAVSRPLGAHPNWRFSSLLMAPAPGAAASTEEAESRPRARSFHGLLQRGPRSLPPPWQPAAPLMAAAARPLPLGPAPAHPAPQRPRLRRLRRLPAPTRSRKGPGPPLPVA